MTWHDPPSPIVHCICENCGWDICGSDSLSWLSTLLSKWDSFSVATWWILSGSHSVFFYEKGQLQLLQKYIFWATISSNLILLLLCYKECERVAATAGQKTVGGFQDHRSCVRYENTNLIKKWWVKTCVKRFILNTILTFFLQGQLILGDASNWWHGRPVSKD